MKQIFFILISVLFFGFSVLGQNGGSNCATVKVVGGGVIEAGSSMSFSAEITGRTKNSILEYEWRVSNGTIAGGQGKSEITVDTSGLPDKTEIKAEVKIRGLLDGCPDTASETGLAILVEIACNGRPMDEFGKLHRNEVRARIDGLFVSLANEMNGQLYIITYGTDKEIAAREKLIKEHISYRKYNANSVIFAKGGENPNGENTVYTKAWIILPGMELPEP